MLLKEMNAILRPRYSFKDFLLIIGRLKKQNKGFKSQKNNFKFSGKQALIDCRFLEFWL
jgi:hypothetical protein